MGDKNKVWEDNIAGAWYVDKECILCSQCKGEAPNNFKESDSGDHYIVYKQPDNKEELHACIMAMEVCCVGAIGKDR